MLPSLDNDLISCPNCPQGSQGHSGPPGDKGIAGEPVSARSGETGRQDFDDILLWFSKCQHCGQSVTRAQVDAEPPPPSPPCRMIWSHSVSLSAPSTPDFLLRIWISTRTPFYAFLPRTAPYSHRKSHRNNLILFLLFCSSLRSGWEVKQFDLNRVPSGETAFYCQPQVVLKTLSGHRWTYRHTLSAFFFLSFPLLSPS